MILSKKVVIRINSRNFNHYKSIIKDIKNNEYYEIDINDILPSSHIKIEVKCDICDDISIKPYREYIISYRNKNIYCCSPNCAQFKNKSTNMEKYGVENIFQVEEFKGKIVQTNMERYGVEYPSQSKEIREKIISSNLSNYGSENPATTNIIKQRMQQTCLIRYGTSNYMSSDIAKLQRIKENKQVPDEQRTKFELYTKSVRNKTNRVKKQLFENWNGLDYYDGENIINNLYLEKSSKNYPTIDHKISIYYGFINNLDPEKLGDLENLCITKRGINSSKHVKCI